MPLDASRDGIANAVLALKQTFSTSEHISHIRFPKFKNIFPNTEVVFTSPLTVLVGANGTNKSSVLKALRGCINQTSISSMWFSTELDIIADRSQYIYGYYNKEYERIVEVLQTRIYDEKNPDYWETSRPLVSLNMETEEEIQQTTGKKRTRWPKIKKGLINIDFRSEVSAFDRAFYQKDIKKTKSYPTIQSYLRYRSNLVKKVVDGQLIAFKWHNVDRVFQNRVLHKSSIEYINQILSQDYSEIRLVEHSLFGDRASTYLIKGTDLKYSEAFAGSGEIAIISMVDKIENLRKPSLILLDEPEVSVHPAAQTQLISYLLEKCRSKHHQIVISSHSGYIIDALPADCLRLFAKTSENQIMIRQTSHSEALFYLGARDSKIEIYTEDNLSMYILRKVAAKMDAAVLSSIHIASLPGGAKTIKSQFIPNFAQTKRVAYFLLDGDEDSKVKIDHSRTIPPERDSGLDEYIKSILGCEPHLAENSNDVNKVETRREFIDYVHDRMGFMPFVTPEDFIVDNCGDENLKLIYEALPPGTKDRAKTAIKNYCLQEIQPPSPSDLSASQIFTVQQILLGKIPGDHVVYKNIAHFITLTLEKKPIR